MALSQSTLNQINEDIDKIVNEKFTRFIEYISRKHRMSHKLLLQDLRDFEEDTTYDTESEPEIKAGQCKGQKADGKRCTFAGKNNGYCARHISQRKVARPPPPSNIVTSIPHNHSFSECLTKIGCPACESQKKIKTSPSEKSLIDF
jgi:hypothetical protein